MEELPGINPQQFEINLNFYDFIMWKDYDVIGEPKFIPDSTGGLYSYTIKPKSERFKKWIKNV